jgi:hypothetical protein
MSSAALGNISPPRPCNRQTAGHRRRTDVRTPRATASNRATSSWRTHTPRMSSSTFLTLLSAVTLLASFASAGVAQTSTPTPRITAVPATHLRDGQSIAVTASGFLPNERVRIYECPTASSPGSVVCPYQIATLPFLDLDPSGAGGTQVVVHTMPSTGLNQPRAISCPSPCLLAAAGVAQDGTSQAAYTRISFS